MGNMDNTVINVILYFFITSYLVHVLLHRVVKKPAQYDRPQGRAKEKLTFYAG